MWYPGAFIHELIERGPALPEIEQHLNSHTQCFLIHSDPCFAGKTMDMGNLFDFMKAFVVLTLGHQFV